MKKYRTEVLPGIFVLVSLLAYFFSGCGFLESFAQGESGRSGAFDPDRDSESYSLVRVSYLDIRIQGPQIPAVKEFTAAIRRFENNPEYEARSLFYVTELVKIERLGIDDAYTMIHKFFSAPMSKANQFCGRLEAATRQWATEAHGWIECMGNPMIDVRIERKNDVLPWAIPWFQRNEIEVELPIWELFDPTQKHTLREHFQNPKDTIEYLRNLDIDTTSLESFLTKDGFVLDILFRFRFLIDFSNRQFWSGYKHMRF